MARLQLNAVILRNSHNILLFGNNNVTSPMKESLELQISKSYRVDWIGSTAWPSQTYSSYIVTRTRKGEVRGFDKWKISKSWVYRLDSWECEEIELF